MTLAPPPSVLNAKPPTFAVHPFPSEPTGGRFVRFIKRLLRPLAILVLSLLGLLLLGAAASAQDTATQLAGVVIVAAPIAMPFVLKFWPKLDGHAMLVATGVISVLVAVAAGLMSHLFSVSDLGTYPGVVAAGTAVFGLAQFVFQIFNQSPALQKYVK